MTKPRRFAEGTSVSVDSSRTELDALLAKHGATQRAVYVDDDQGLARVQFRLSERLIRLDLRVRASDLPAHTGSYHSGIELPKGWGGWSLARRKEWIAARQEQFAREAWRRLLLVTKAKLELVADGSTTVEREFLADVVLPDGQTVHQTIASKLSESYASGAMPKLLGDGT